MANLDSSTGGQWSESNACPACGAAQTGRGRYCEECGGELPANGAATGRRRVLLVACTLAWAVGLVVLLVWLTGHALLLK